jgi:hypothetical protein
LHRNRDIPAPVFSGEHLDIDNTSEQSFAVNPNFRVLHLDEMDSVHHVVRSGAFSGSPDGPSVSHLHQDYNALITDMKLKPGMERQNKNDYFNLLVSLTTGGARDQATALERELIDDRAERNAAARRKYERDLAETTGKCYYRMLELLPRSRPLRTRRPSLLSHLLSPRNSPSMPTRWVRYGSYLRSHTLNAPSRARMNLPNSSCGLTRP